MSFFERYDKNIMESFAINTIAASYDKTYEEYYAPSNSDNFDYVSPSGEQAVEITTVIPKNEINAYSYEKLKAKKKTNLKTAHIVGLKIKPNGDIYSYYGGSISEILHAIRASLESKQKKALKRLNLKPYKMIDLCICIQDGSLLDLFSFELAFKDLDKYIFEKIFFITPSHFIVYNKTNGFIEYPRITAGQDEEKLKDFNKFLHNDE